MLTYCYAAVRTGQAANLGAGIDGQALEALQVGPVSVITSKHHTRPLPVKEHLVEHNRVNLMLLEQGAVIPFRFGNTFPSGEAMADALTSNRLDWPERFSALDGRLEVGVKLMSRADAQPATPSHRTTSGHGYLRAAQQRMASEASGALFLSARAAEFRASVSDLLSDSREAMVGPRLLSMPCLTPKDSLSVFRTRFAEFQARHPELRALLSGPWPAYSFVQP